MIGTDDYELYEHSPEEKQYQPAKTNEAYFTNCQEYRDLASRHKRIVEHQRQGWRNRGGLWEECYCPNSDAFGSSSVEYDRIPCYEMEETDAPAAEQNTDRDACKKYKEAAAKHGYEIGKPRFEGQECGCYKTFSWSPAYIRPIKARRNTLAAAIRRRQRKSALQKPQTFAAIAQTTEGGFQAAGPVTTQSERRQAL